MAPEHITVSSDMLSDFCKEIKAENWKPMQKLVPNLFDTINYVCHYRNLQFYIKHGLVLTKIYRVISFDQSPWLEPWVDYCTERRKMARDEFESDLAKLQANATFGKTMEQVRQRVNVRLICDPNKLAKAVSRPTFHRAEIINDDLTLVRAARQRVTLNKPISVGFSITTNFTVTISNPNTWTAVNCYSPIRTPSAAIYRQRTYTKTWPKISSYLTPVILSRPIRCT